MKLTVSRLKTLAQDNMGSSQTLSYVKYAEVTQLEAFLLDFSRTLLPSILLTPDGTEESWESTQRKVATHHVTATLMMEYNQRELGIIGDPSRPSGQGILDFVNDFLTVFRGTRLSVGGVNYLHKPLDIVKVKYFRGDMSDNVYLLVATIDILCVRLFTQASLPGDI